MRFLGRIWRLLVGVKDGLVLLFMLLFFGLLYAALTAKPYAGTVREGALLLDLSGTIVEQPAETDTLQLVTGGSSLTREYRLRDLVHALDTAATDDRIKAVALDLDIFTGGGQTAIANVADALDRVRRTGKPVIAYASGYSDDSYQLAAHASEIWVNPLGGVLITGPGGTSLYYKGLLDKLGITANVYKAGTYKAATEPFTRNDMSPESEEALRAVYGQLWEQWQADVSQARPKAQIEAYVAAPVDRMAAAGGDLAKASLAAGLVDRIGDRTAFQKRVAEIAGVDDEDVPGSFRTTSYDAWVAENPAGDPYGGRIGVLTVAGTIVDGEAELGTAGAETIVKALEKGLKENSLEALVVRVDSPGGSTLASERIRQAVLAAKAQGLPVVISMGSVAASGGYWIATAGDKIMAEPSTITGSIGVFGVLPSFEGTLEMLGIGTDGVQTTPLSGEPDLLNGPSPQAERLLQMGVDSTYQRFLSIVAAARDMPVGRVDEIAQGRIWTGGMAHQLGLVDSFGSLEDAVSEAARMAGIDPEDAEPVFLEKEPDFFDQMLRSASSESPPVSRDAFAVLAERPQQIVERVLASARQILAGPTIQARCLECSSSAPPQATRAEASFSAWLWSRLTG